MKRLKLENLTLNFDIGSTTKNVNIELSGKETEKYPRYVFTIIIFWIFIWEFTLFKQCETYKQLKERETFWKHWLKNFYPFGLDEKEKHVY